MCQFCCDVKMTYVGAYPGIGFPAIHESEMLYHWICDPFCYGDTYRGVRYPAVDKK